MIWILIGWKWDFRILRLPHSIYDFPDLSLMPFSEKVGFVFQLWLYRTLVYELCAKIDKNGDSAGKKKSEEASGKKGDSSGKPSLNFTKTFKLHFQGSRFTVGDGYLVHSKGRNSQFEHHIETVIKSFKQNFGLC